MRGFRDRRGRPRVYANRSASLHFINISPARNTAARIRFKNRPAFYTALGALQSVYARLGVDENNNCVIDRPYAATALESCTAVCKCTILFKALSALPFDFRVTLRAVPLSLFPSRDGTRPNARQAARTYSPQDPLGRFFGKIR